MNRLEQLREAAALSRADLARRSDVSQTVIKQLEAGAHLEEGERAIEMPGETPVENIAVILNKLADALSANLFGKGIAVSPEELLGPAHEDLAAAPEVAASDETLPALPLVGVSKVPPPVDLPPEALSQNETATPANIDASLKQLAPDAEMTASEEAAETGADEVNPEPAWPEGPVSPAASVSTEDSAPAEEGLAPTGGPETINMAELPDTLPIGVLPGTPAMVETKEVLLMTDSPAREFASQETQEIYIPPEVLATLPTYSPSTEAATTAETSAKLEDSEPVAETPALAANDAPTMSFSTSEVRAQAAKDTTELEAEEMTPALAATLPGEEAATETPGDYEVVPGPDMPGPAPAPETMEAASEAHPAPPDLAVVESAAVATAPEISTPSPEETEANLGLPTAHEVDKVVPNTVAPLVLAVEPTPLEVEAATPVQDDGPLTKSQPEQLPEMQPYIGHAPTEAETNRYKLPLSTVIPSVAGVVGVMGWFLWRSWRRARAEAEKVAPYSRKK
jgi:transcriptional regulator with XRE-family HTH domain